MVYRELLENVEIVNIIWSYIQKFLNKRTQLKIKMCTLEKGRALYMYLENNLLKTVIYFEIIGKL